ncbi:hypothetical protein B0J11DRAFT_594770 [Dendryphion nanum]|uniref:Uncharacterized protein n=1 Tax=Dendryphion nanum TaxID=256645 RepID=A0A9P9IBW4_9PLEO|nr:hypothetical protein B0J11DRAFT_594770 [Dendryphion nanum]
MPVTIFPSPEQVGRNTDRIAESTQHLMLFHQTGREETMSSQTAQAGKIWHHSFPDLSEKGAEKVILYGNGFVNGAIRAFQQDLHLKIRPDDVWLSILTQFSFYVNAHVEELREKFVAHEGKKELVIVKEASSLKTAQVDDMARDFTRCMEEQLVDPELRNWIIAEFSTTTPNDVAVASMVMMSTLKGYFDYSTLFGCGLPSVTLLGEREDWEMLLKRLDKLDQFGPEPTQWTKLLRAVLRRFVATFSDPESKELKKFWLQIVHANRQRGSGLPNSSFSGWITVFAYWEGKTADDGSTVQPRSGWWMLEKSRRPIGF